MAVDTTTLVTFLGSRYVHLVIQKGWFGKQYIRFYHYFELGNFLYGKGAILGRAFHDRFEILGEMLGSPPHDTCILLQNEARERLQRYGKEPESWIDFFMTTELVKFGSSYPEGLLLKSQEKIPVEKAYPKLQWLMLEGMGFGSSFPELTERMWRQTYETPDPEIWAKARRAGVDIPEEQESLPLEESEHELLLAVAAYAHDRHPELIEPLGLRKVEQEVAELLDISQEELANRRERQGPR